MKYLLSIFLSVMAANLFGQDAVSHLSAHATEDHPGIPSSPVIHTVSHHFVVNAKAVQVKALRDESNAATGISLPLTKGDTFILQFQDLFYNSQPMHLSPDSSLPQVFEGADGIKSIVFSSSNISKGRYRPVYEVNGKTFEFHLPKVADDQIKRNYYPTTRNVPMRMAENEAGLLVPDFEKHPDLPRQNIAHIPPKGLLLHDRPGGTALGRLSRFCPVAKYSDGNMRMFILPNENTNDCKHITLAQLHHWSDDAYMIPYSRVESGYVQLFNDRDLGGTWVKLADILDQDFRLLGWKDYLIERRDLPAFANDPGLDLLESPYADAKKILNVQGDAMQIWITGHEDGFCEGRWCKVSVKVYKENPCTSSLPEQENLSGTYEGWIELISEDGQPNVYMNTKGC